MSFQLSLGRESSGNCRHTGACRPHCRVSPRLIASSISELAHPPLLPLPSPSLSPLSSPLFPRPSPHSSPFLTPLSSSLTSRSSSLLSPLRSLLEFAPVENLCYSFPDSDTDAAAGALTHPLHTTRPNLVIVSCYHWSGPFRVLYYRSGGPAPITISPASRAHTAAGRHMPRSNVQNALHRNQKRRPALPG